MTPVRIATISIVTVIILGVAIVVCYFVILFRSFNQFPDAYASDWMAVFVIEHLKSTDGQWPRSWEDLRDEYDTMAEPSHYAWTFAELQDRVVFDWNANVDQVAIADPPLDVFQLTSGQEVSFGGNPDVLIRDYLLLERESDAQAAPESDPP